MWLTACPRARQRDRLSRHAVDALDGRVPMLGDATPNTRIGRGVGRLLPLATVTSTRWLMRLGAPTHMS
jgi:hypothetical protein